MWRNEGVEVYVCMQFPAERVTQAMCVQRSQSLPPPAYLHTWHSRNFFPNYSNKRPLNKHTSGTCRMPLCCSRDGENPFALSVPLSPLSPSFPPHCTSVVLHKICRRHALCISLSLSGGTFRHLFLISPLPPPWRVGGSYFFLRSPSS